MIEVGSSVAGEAAEQNQYTKCHANVPISTLDFSGSPRLDGENPAHTRLLAEIDAALPPILVHRQTMRVIDGRHRLRAANLRGEQTIAVEYFDGDEDRAFLLSVSANLSHGLPLSLADRKAAAEQIIRQHPEWSDRAIAAAAGLSAGAVSAIRRETATGGGELTARIGRDGRVRPIDPTQGRLRASRILAERPRASLREIAKEAGIAVGTARDVRDRVRRGLDPAPVNHREEQGAPPEQGHEAPKTEFEQAQARFDTLTATLQSLKKDPSLRFTESGRRLLRWLEGHALKPEDSWVVPSSPPHCAVLIADIARHNALMLHSLADVLEQQGQQAM
ncbi:ParB/RepB/Spo0J family partition protein [Actinocrispum wychmicini]|uniref:ParB/RepB/Spo0J family partition protein n=1 Tax=Actinocrispum wychmicini TaxID=1213861 RepID=UPI001FB67E84|nr:ParB/RepB/Spo0J family partition protein [Actinocrispum wychmicini]